MNLFEGIHGGSLSNMDAVEFIGFVLAPAIENHEGDGLTLWKLWVILQLPRYLP